MQLGLTIPLRRCLRLPDPPPGEPMDRLFCWDLHRIVLRGRGSLLAVHCASRYTLVVCGLTEGEWGALADTALEAIRRGVSRAGAAEAALSAYLRRAGAPCFTRTHGRREVAFLNRAWEDVAAMDAAVDLDAQSQPLLERVVNDRPCRCAGEAGTASSRERLLRMLGETDVSLS